jgi:transcriptional regulator with GAF, ATPase, and Fis domain
VFLDEIGELDMAIQVKILRVLQSRTFQRIGDTETLPFEGKIIAATNRDLASEVQAGRFREDLYYRLCSDTILTPSLRDQVRDNPGELRHLITHIIQRIVGEADDSLIGQVEQWIAGRLGPTYPWPGNVRELEQCVRNILVRGEYRPLRHAPTTPIGGREALAAEICRGTLTADEMLGQYCALVYASCGSYVETARRLGMDRRTVRRRIDPVLARRLPA